MENDATVLKIQRSLADTKLHQMRKPRIPKLYSRKPFSKDAYGDNWKEHTRSVKVANDGCCFDCGATANLQTHHIIPLTKGGTNSTFNLITLCNHCHSKRHKHLKRRRLA